MRATVLGTSAAWPIPRPGCACPQCAEAREDGRLRRTRSALRLEVGSEVLLVDAGPDLFHQFERDALPPRVDRVLVTHTHPDHVLGLDDLVNLRGRAETPLVVHAAPVHRERIHALFPHLVRPGRERVAFADWSDGTRLEVGDAHLEGFETGHREALPTVALLAHLAGGRRLAFATDLCPDGAALPAASRERLEGVDLFVGDGTYLGAGGYGHPGTDDVLRLAREVGARAVALTHVGHVGVRDAGVRERLGGDVLVLRDGQDLPL